jgi:hypothetical protein
VAAFVAGPVIRNTSAAPGDMPLATMAAATGIDDVAQTYIGTPNASIASIPTIPLPSQTGMEPSGSSAPSAPAISIPTIRALPIEAGRVMNP